MTQTAGPAIANWSTDAVPPAQRLDYYQDMLASAVTPMWISGAEPESFDSNVTMADLGPITIFRMRGTPHCAHRGSSQIERSRERTFHLVLEPTAPVAWRHRGSVRLAPGETLLCDTNLSFDLDLSTRYDCINLRLAEKWLHQWVPAPQVLVGRRIPANAGWGRALCAFVAQMSPERVLNAPLPARVIVDQIGALLALVASEAGPARQGSARADPALIDQIRDQLAQRCAEPALTATLVAAALDISTRTLHRCLAAAGTTFGTLLLAARADLAVRMLESSLHRRLTIAEIGRRAGFADASHLARVLRRRFGRPPSQIRTGGNEPAATVDGDRPPS